LKRTISIGGAIIIGTISIALAQGNNGIGGINGNASASYAIGLWGDLPYSAIQETVGLPNLIDDMNSQKLAFTVHDGDLKTGNAAPICDDALYLRALGWFNALDAPAIFTPGDNDWTDCDRPANGSFNSLERLQHERQVMFSTNRSFGEHTMKAEVQSTPSCVGTTNTTAGSTAGPYFPTPCVENRRWTFHKVTFATVNVQGTCNNICSSGGGAPDAGGDPTEYNARNAADIAWLQQTFDEAKAKHSAGLMIVWQADPGWDLTDATRAPLRNPTTLAETDGQPDGYQAILSELRDLTIDFRKPVVLVHGDSHYFRIDKPFLDSQGRRLENFTRVETFGDHQENGDNDVHWLKALIDPQSRDVFAFQPQIVPANRVAVPSP